MDGDRLDRGEDQVPQRGHALHVDDPLTGERNVLVGSVERSYEASDEV